ncbi:uncharacterized protein [Typha angustifolia]|uniref:uncharacterized protein isoform X1 n=1 Tax=Typha angustifolia TaxID=59011 RepID=UPI003C2E0B27
MNRGAKRPAFSDDAAEIPLFTLPSKRVMDAPSFDVHRAESSHQHVMEGPAFDVQRAESARRHVRALNTQFASWVQLQLQNHPDELWEDGMEDYQSHASQIMEKFKDVVDWLRANAAKSRTELISSSLGDQKNFVSGPENNNTLCLGMNNGPTRLPIPASFSALQNTCSENSFLFSTSQTPAFTGLPGGQNNLFLENAKPTLRLDTNSAFSKQDVPSFSFRSMQSSGSQSSTQTSVNQAPFFPGNQGPTTSLNVEASGDMDEESKQEPPSSPSFKRTEEKGIVVVHETKCKVYVKPENPVEKGWKDMGMGQLSIKCKEGADRATKESKPSIVIRNDVGKILLNASIYPGIKINIQKNTIASIFHVSGGGPPSDISGSSSVVARTYLLRLKNEEETTKLAAAIKDNAPSD